MLPLSILCTTFSSFLAISPEAVFYDQQQPIRFHELWSQTSPRNLLNIMTETLWQVGNSPTGLFHKYHGLEAKGGCRLLYWAMVYENPAAERLVMRQYLTACQRRSPPIFSYHTYLLTGSCKEGLQLMKG